LAGSWEPPDNDGWERSTVGFAFYHSLVDDPPEHAAPVLELLGRIAASWSRMEHHLDALIIQVNKPEHDPALFESHPVSFSKKVELLKRWFYNYSPLADDKEDIKWLAQKLGELANERPNKPLSRNVLLHSIPASFDAEKQELTLHHMKVTDSEILSRHIVIPMEGLRAFADAIQLANTFLRHITELLFTDEGYAKISRKPE